MFPYPFYLERERNTNIDMELRNKLAQIYNRRLVIIVIKNDLRMDKNISSFQVILFSLIEFYVNIKQYVIFAYKLKSGGRNYEKVFRGT